MLNEINDLAGQHEVIAENLSTAVVADLTTAIRFGMSPRAFLAGYLQPGPVAGRGAGAGTGWLSLAAMCWLICCAKLWLSRWEF